mmetsp:Transcript_16828/g.43215  ORF Transcript_16828/g.43215 Transcript_16828/m.43215 type:complete len:398 (-) Transcript_16828:129-1322(-)
MGTTAMPYFYIYRGAAFDHDFLLNCWPGWRYDEFSAEVPLLAQLKKHSSRVMHASKADLFIVPVLPYVSFVAGLCKNTTHEQRMEWAASTLAQSPHLARHQGHDHLVVTNTFRLLTLRALKPLLVNSSVAWFEQHTARRPGPMTLYRQVWWRCTVVIPYLGNPFCQTPDAFPPMEREKSIFFRGSWAVGGMVRRRFGEVADGIPGAAVRDVPRSGGRYASPMGVHGNTAIIELPRHGTLYETAQGYRQSRFCLVPKGDTPTSARLFDAISCGCVPLVISDHLRDHLPFRDLVPYAEFLRGIDEHKFALNPVGAVSSAMRELEPNLPQIRASMLAAAPKILYDAPKSTVASSMLTEWGSRCAVPAVSGADRARFQRDFEQRSNPAFVEAQEALTIKGS